MGGSLLAAIIMMVLASNRVEALPNERASFGGAVEERVFDLSCPSLEGNLTQVVVLGREREGGFQIEGYRYRVQTGGKSGVASLSMTAGGGRNQMLVAFEENLVANGRWQSRRASQSSIVARNSQAIMALSLRFAGGGPAACEMPVAF